ncbi:MAG: hypothetical protein JXR73_03845 [Candidatus Omnitrophica bacterium]|nr:hypothetical protein [Candidatus Omnitrophota bacterium]
MNSIALSNTPNITDFFQPPAIGMQPTAGDGKDFSSVLSEAMQPQDQDVRISAHARQRMETRDINLDKEDLEKLDEAIDKAEEKGSRNSLIVMKQNAFVVNIDNRTVITAMDASHGSNQIFTQIGSAVFV